jgi:hypothetical protein
MYLRTRQKQIEQQLLWRGSRELDIAGFANGNRELGIGRASHARKKIYSVLGDVQPLRWSVCTAKRHLHRLTVGGDVDETKRYFFPVSACGSLVALIQHQRTAWPIRYRKRGV